MYIAGELDAMAERFGVSVHLSRIHEDSGRNVPKWCAETTCGADLCKEVAFLEDKAEKAVVKLIFWLQAQEAHEGAANTSSAGDE